MNSANNRMESYGRWNHVKLLGEGGFGEVHHFHNRYTGHEIATKRLKYNPKLKQDEIQIMHKRWRQEYEWMKALKTPFIVGALQIDDTDFINYLKNQNVSPDLPVIIMEFCNGGDLRQRLNKMPNLNGLREHEVRDILRTLRHAIEYLHQECNIEHRDIKPENVVIHNKGNEKLYKLTDFGYARDIPESTIAQSIVGTRHYVAPEVIDPGVYSKTVDYWGIGVMAYEIICGERPFIPHQHLIQIMTEIKKKPKQCIAIVETECEGYQFVQKICPENHLSPIFKEKIEKWFQLALDNNYKKRGFDNQNQLMFYRELDDILATKIVTIFSLKTHRIYYYDIGKFNDLQEFFNELSKDTGILFTHSYIIFPTNHPKGSLANIKTPMDLFVPEWCDAGNSDNPPVMLYINDVTQCDFNVKLNEMYFSETFKKYMSKDPQNCKDLPVWVFQHFETIVHFMLSNQQHLLECYLNGLYEHVISVENEVCLYESVVDELFQDFFILNGRILQFSETVNEASKTLTDESAQVWLQKADLYLKNIQIHKNNIVQKVKIRFKSVLRHCNKLTNMTIHEKLFKSDIFKVKNFQQYVLKNHFNEDKHNNIERMDYCQRAVETFTTEYENFLKHKELKEIREDLHLQFTMYLKISDCVGNIQKQIHDTKIRLAQDTKDLVDIIRTSRANDPIITKMQSLSIYGNSGVYPSLCNGEAVFDGSTSKVIEESNELLTLIDSSMVDTDEDYTMHVDIPLTINNI